MNKILTVAIIVRTYFGDKHAFMNKLGPTMDMFVDKSQFELIAVLDAENLKDHTFGKSLLDYGFKVFYEPLPLDNVLDTRPFKNNLVSHYTTAGYTRQLYSTFFLDNYTFADIIGIVDADNMFQTFLTTSNIYDDNGRIYLPAINGNHYAADSLCLNETVKYDFMYTDIMPKFFYRKTFATLRDHILRVSNSSNFNNAWKYFATDYLSPANVLSYYGSKYEPLLYRLVLPSDPVGYIPVASNRPNNLGWKVGCCRTFQLLCSELVNISLDTINFRNAEMDTVWKHPYVSWCHNVSLLFKNHYTEVSKYLDMMETKDMDNKLRMQAACKRGLSLEIINGSAIKLIGFKNKRIYFMFDGKKRLIPNVDTMMALNIREILNLSDDVFNRILEGDCMPLLDHP